MFKEMSTYSNLVIKKIDDDLVDLISNEMNSKSVFDLETLINELEETQNKYKLSQMAEHVLVLAQAEYDFRIRRLNQVGIGLDA